MRDGLLLITSLESMDYLLKDTDRDPFQIVGHCLIAVIAAVLGGLWRRSSASWLENGQGRGPGRGRRYFLAE